ncbi:Prefoldin subunit 6 [Yarrowia sp. B02]|nr:Prefoldin subunit 6 [Yarrowia sp. B02]
MEDQKKFEQLSGEFEVVQQSMQKLIESRQKLEAQLQENLIVEDEFKTVKDDAKVYKLTGPVLVPQSIDEAKGNVEKRLEFIRGQITSVEDEVAGLQKQAEEKRDQVSMRSREV